MAEKRNAYDDSTSRDLTQEAQRGERMSAWGKHVTGMAESTLTRPLLIIISLCHRPALGPSSDEPSKHTHKEVQNDRELEYGNHREHMEGGEQVRGKSGGEKESENAPPPLPLSPKKRYAHKSSKEESS